MRSRLAVCGALCALLLLGGCRSSSRDERAGRASVDYTIRFEGHQAFTRGQLLDVIDDNLIDFQRSGHGKAAIDDAAFELEQLYRDAGFYRALVDYVVDVEGRRVTLIVEEGPRIKLGRLAILGVESIELETVRQLASAQRHEDGWYSDARVDRAGSVIAGWYRSLGFLDVRVEITDLEIADDKASLALVVTEGPASRLNSVFFSGELVFDEAELARVVASDIGQPYTPRRTARMLGIVETHHADRGYPDVRVALNELERGDQGAVNLALSIQPGPRVHISEIQIEGAEKTRDSFVHARLTIEAGDLYSAQAERDSFRALYSSGLFSRIEMDLLGSGEDRILLVRLAEDWSREVFIEPGWGSYDRLRLRGGIRERNFLGTGRIGRIEGLISERTSDARIGLTDPWFMDTDITADASVVYTRREEPSFEYEDFGIDLSLFRRWGRADSGSATYTYKRSNLLSQDFTAQPIPGLSDDIGISSIRIGHLRDTRNQFVVPSAGHRTEFSLEWADQVIGSELDFLRGTVSFAGFHRLAPHSILAASARTGLIQPTGSTNTIPLQERYFNGGENTVRSYGESQLGPQDPSGNPIGGETFTVLSVELRQDLPGRIEGALFADGGNVALDVSDYLEFDDFGFAIGIGLRYVLPVGPLRLDLGINPDPREGDADYTIHFSVGRPY